MLVNHREKKDSFNLVQTKELWCLLFDVFVPFSISVGAVGDVLVGSNDRPRTWKVYERKQKGVDKGENVNAAYLTVS